MSNIERYTSTTSSRITLRQTGRQLSSIQARTDVAIAKTEAKAQIGAARVEAVAAVTQRGQQAAAFIAQVAEQLVETVPSSAPLVASVTRTGALALSMVVMDTVYETRNL